MALHKQRKTHQFILENEISQIDYRITQVKVVTVFSNYRTVAAKFLTYRVLAF